MNDQYDGGLRLVDVCFGRPAASQGIKNGDILVGMLT